MPQNLPARRATRQAAIEALAAAACAATSGVIWYMLAMWLLDFRP